MAPLDKTLETVEQVARDGGLPVMVFDLDSTLFNTAGRHLAIVQAFAEQHPSVRTVADQLSHGDFGWHVDQPLRDRGVDEPVLEALRGFWFERFFHDDWLHHDHAAKGGPEFVRQAHQRGALIYYLTGRDAVGMATGTTRALQQRGYPFYTGRTVLHLKPSFEMEDTAFKDQAMADIRSHGGQVVATFENEPGNANLFLQHFPDAVHYLVGSVCNPESPDPHDHVVRIPDFVPR